MVFEINPETKSLVARLPSFNGIEEFDCGLTTCPNPVCTCETVTIGFLARSEDVSSRSRPAPARKVELDIGARAIDDSFRKTAARYDITFAKILLAAMTPDDFDLLSGLHYGSKRRATDRAKPSEIKAHFDFDAIERDAVMQTYNDILPFAEMLQIVINGIGYVVLDQYCLRTGCDCTEVSFKLLLIEEAGDTVGAPGWARVDYHAKRWQTSPNEPLPCDASTFRRLMERTIPDLYAKLRARHKKLAAIYAHARKRARPADADSSSQKS